MSRERQTLVLAALIGLLTTLVLARRADSIGYVRDEGIYFEASRRPGDTSEHLVGILESRLDAIVYRAKFVPTVFAARQFINHGHVQVNGKKVNIPSYRCKPGDIVSVKESSRDMALVLEATQLAGFTEPEAKRFFGRHKDLPKIDLAPLPATTVKAHFVQRFKTLSKSVD